MLYELAYLKKPFNGGSMQELYFKITKGEYEEIPKGNGYRYGKRMVRLIRRLLDVNPDKRPDCKELLATYSVQPAPSRYWPSQRKPSSDPLQPLTRVQLLNTIKLPLNLDKQQFGNFLKKNLPKSNYPRSNLYGIGRSNRHGRNVS